MQIYVHPTSIYNRLPENEHSDSKHVEDIINYNISLENVHFVGKCCVIMLQRAVQEI